MRPAFEDIAKINWQDKPPLPVRAAPDTDHGGPWPACHLTGMPLAGHGSKLPKFLA